MRICFLINFLLSFSLLAGELIVVNNSNEIHVFNTPEGKRLKVLPRSTKKFDLLNDTGSMSIDGRCILVSNDEIIKVTIDRNGKIHIQKIS